MTRSAEFRRETLVATDAIERALEEMTFVAALRELQ
jgi:hypothetical protein